MRLIILLFITVFCIHQSHGQNFSEQAASWNIDLGNNKNGGHSFADYDGDGDLDLLVNTDNNTQLSRLYRNNGNQTFTDITSSLAPALLVNVRERCAIWGDLNNDGLLDFLRNTGNEGAQKIEVYLQGSNGKFGNGAGSTTPIYIGDKNTDDVTIVNGINSEGTGFLDFDGDGDLDIIFDNHDYGIDVLRNNYINHTNNTVVNPSAVNLFTHVTPGTSTILGLAQSAVDGDYGSFTDVNNDGWVDIFMRKQNENDFFLNQGGTFINGSDLGQAANGNKGAVALYDFDNDGDFDAFWTENGLNQIFRNNGGGSWTALGSATGIPTGSNDIDEVACGDIDNDGDIDILLVGDNRSYLYLNQLNDPVNGVGAGTAMNFVVDNTQQFNVGEDGEGTTMVDIDDDGDLDIYMNIHNDDNQLWINDLYNNSTNEANKNYLFVEILEDRSFMQNNKKRPALGATVILLDCNDNIISGIREVNGGGGHGTQIPNRVHFGLPWGRNYNYKVLVKYPNYKNGGTTREEVVRWINPSTLNSFPVSISINATDNDTNCPSIIEICDNNIDDDGDGQIDCLDPNCGKPVITNVNVTAPTCVGNGVDGQIVITVTTSISNALSYSIDDGNTWQSNNTFSSLGIGQYQIKVKNTNECITTYSSNPIIFNALSCSEVCNNNQDDDGDGFIDCADSDCQPIISNVIATQPTCANKTGGQIVITASGNGILAYSINNSPTYQASNTFTNLGVGQYIIRVRNDSGCETTYINNPIILDIATCIEICNDGIDNDGDGFIDCDDSDCKNVGTATGINEN